MWYATAFGWLKDAVSQPAFASGTVGTLVGTLVGGGITLFGQRLSIRETRQHRSEDTRLRRLASTTSLMLKLCKIAKSIINSETLLESRHAAAAAEGRDLSNPAAFCPPMVGAGDKMEFSPDELATLLHLSENDIFNQCLGLDDMFNTYEQLIATYNEKRNMLTGRLQPAEFDVGTGAGTVHLTPEQRAQLLPIMFDCNSALSELRAMAAEAEKAYAAADAIAQMQGRKLGMKLVFDRVAPRQPH